MRLGCLGCLFFGIIVLGVVIIVMGGVVFAPSVFTPPERLPTAVEWSAADGYRAQQKIYEILRRDTNRSSRTDPLFFTEREINAFLTRHLDEVEGLPVSPLVVRLTPGIAVIQGKTKFKAILRGVPFNYLAGFLPASQIERPVWVEIRCRVALEHGRIRKEREFLRLEPVEFRVGTLEAGTWFVSWVLGQKLLRWPVPRIIHEVVVEEGRAIVMTQGGG